MRIFITLLRVASAGSVVFLIAAHHDPSGTVKDMVLHGVVALYAAILSESLELQQAKGTP